MKVFGLLTIFIFGFICVHAQKHDYIWVGGENAVNSPNTPNVGGFLIDFNQSPAASLPINRVHNLFQSCGAISDSSGQLAAYTNGCVIASGATDEIIENGNNINPGSVHNQYCNPNSDFGYYPSTIQSSLFLPLPDTTGIYYLFHKTMRILNNPVDVINDTFYYSVVDMNLNGGEGRVVKKNTYLMVDTMASGMITAVKHANGKDWWIVTPRRKEDEIYSFLMTKEGIKDTVLNHIGFTLIGPYQEGSCEIIFTPDGSKMITSNPYTGIGIFDFDRTTGILSNYRAFPIANMWPSTDFVGCAVSPNSRYLYITAIYDLFQYDLEAEDVAASQVLVGVWDGAADPLATAFAQPHLGPDCKIYIQTSQQAKTLHVIHHPNEAGTACNLEQRGFPLPRKNRGSLPYFPNFRLGPIDQPGLPCTSVTNSEHPPTPLPEVSVFPNPASNFIKVVPNRLYKDAGTVRLFHADGRLALTYPLDWADMCTVVPIRTLAEGLYFYEVRAGDEVVRSGKVVVRRGE